MKRELKEWKKGRKRSILPGVVFVLFIVLFSLAMYANSLVQERSVQEELKEKFHGEFAATALLYQAGTDDPSGLSDAQGLPVKLSISETGEVIFNGTVLAEKSELKITKIGKQQKKEFADTYEGFSEKDPLEGEKSYYISFQTGTDNAAGIYYIDGRLLFTPDKISIYEIKTI